MRNILLHTKVLCCLLLFVVMLFSCDGTKYLAEDELLLTRVRVVSADPAVNVGTLLPYVKQTPNTKWFSSLKVPLGIYSMAGRDTTKAINRRLRKWGEEPVVLSKELVRASCGELSKEMQNRGYLDVEILPKERVLNKRVTLIYNVVPHERYSIRNVTYNISDHRIDSLLHTTDILTVGLSNDYVFSINALHAKRNEITEWLNENGYIYFNKEAITFRVDSARQEHLVDITMNIGLFRRSSNEPLREHPYYTFNRVTYSTPDGYMFLRPRTLDINTLLREGDVYNVSNVQNTYNKFARLQAVRSTNIHFSEVSLGTDSASLFSPARQMDALVQLSSRKPHSIRIQPEGTNTAGDFGAAMSLTYENRNVFNGSEVFSLQARGAYEAIRGLEGYHNNDYVEYNVEGKLTFPEFVVPYISRDFLRRHNATTELAISYNRQNRPEFQRRVLTAAWRYRWQSSRGRIGYQYDFLDVNYVSMPVISETFKHDYLESGTSANAILRYNYEDLLIMKMGFGVNYNDGVNSFKINVETAGNLLNAAARTFRFERNEEGQYKFARVAYAQYAKLDVDYTHILKLDERNSLALHARVGIAKPYGNSSILPFEKRYFAGGANSVRGWSVRSLGPGRYTGRDGRIDFINQTGDMRIDLNAELRTKLFWKFYGAIFVDAGNIWTLKEYEDQPGGQFTLRSLYDEIAAAYGVGLRMNFDYFVLRLDLGMKAVSPNYTTSKEHFPIIHPRFSRDYALHFAVGLPF